MREFFDLDPSLIYLNSGTHSICPRSVLEAVTRYQRDYERNPTQGLLQAWGRLWRVQLELAAFFHADAADLFLRPNVTAALNDFILSLPLSDKTEILYSDLEYGAIINVCRLRAERDGFRLRSFRFPVDPAQTSGMAEADWVDLIASEIRPETGLLLISHINCVNGLVLPIDPIGRMAREKGVVLVVDGAHGPGSIDLDFRRLTNVDCYGGNLHKWMMGPKGTAFGWVSKRCQDHIAPIAAAGRRSKSLRCFTTSAPTAVFSLGC